MAAIVRIHEDPMPVSDTCEDYLIYFVILFWPLMAIPVLGRSLGGVFGKITSWLIISINRMAGYKTVKGKSDD